MLKTEVTKEYTKISAMGTLPTLCTDLTHIIHAILSEMDEDMAKEFKLSLMQAMKEGILFRCSKAEMEQLEKEREERLSKFCISDEIDELLDMLYKTRDNLKKAKEDIEKMGGNDEAE